MTRFDPFAVVANLPDRPGVYRMIGPEDEVLYVGKARNLRRRVASYFSRHNHSPRILSMVSKIRDVQVTVTGNDTEALLLESNLIKSLRPRYNILLRDDKSYPYIYLSSHQRFPRFSFHRGARSGPGRYFGPYPSASAVRETLNLLQKLFPVRQCADSYYRNRTRPCLQHQINRCTAPCVGLVDEAAYKADVAHAVMFLEGRSDAVIDDLAARMQAASEAQEFERAARYRDQIEKLRQVHARQYVSGSGGNVDVIAARTADDTGCISVFYIRDGRNLGDRTFFPRYTGEQGLPDLLAAFIAQYYLDREVPHELIVNTTPRDHRLLEQALSDRAGSQVRVATRVRGERSRWLDIATTNAEQALNRHIAGHEQQEARFAALGEALDLPMTPNRIECFDISHTAGDETLAACVVFDRNGPVKSDYRRFNIRGEGAGDDYAAMRQALERRFRRLQKGEGIRPDLLLIDGGKGQVGQALKVLSELAIDDVLVVGVAKGPQRKAGAEQLFLSASGPGSTLPSNSPALHLIQQVRDEAHRFAVTGHRQRRGKAQKASLLDEIPGIGAKRRSRLVTHFGGLKGVANARVEDLSRVPGISRQLAETIYNTFHGKL